MRDRPSSVTFLEELVQRLKYACKVIRMRDYYSALVSKQQLSLPIAI